MEVQLWLALNPSGENVEQEKNNLSLTEERRLALPLRKHDVVHPLPIAETNSDSHDLVMKGKRIMVLWMRFMILSY